MTVTRTYYSGDLGQVHARVAGDPKNPTLLLLHQVPSTSEMFEAIMLPLGEHFYCIAPDMPGFGMSPKIAECTVSAFSVHLWGALAQVVRTPMHIVGHHTGTALAVEIAVRYPEAVKSLALSGPALLSDEMKAILPSKAAPIPQQDDGGHVDIMWQRIRGKDDSVHPDVTSREVKSALEIGDLYLDTYNAVIDYPFEEKLREISPPSLVFAGTEDVLHYAVDPTFSAIKNAKKQELKGLGGYLFDTHPNEVAELLLDFYKGLEG